MKIGGILKSVVGAVAPTLGTALGGPMGGMAAKMISEVLLKPLLNYIIDTEKITEDDITNFILNVKTINIKNILNKK